MYGFNCNKMIDFYVCDTSVLYLQLTREYVTVGILVYLCVFFFLCNSVWICALHKHIYALCIF